MRRTRGPALFLASFTLASWSSAQEPAGDQPTTNASGVQEDEEPSDEERQDAEESFHAGDEAYDVQKYQLALGYFRESYELVASPNTRLMIARCLLELGRLDESYEEYMGLLSLPEDDEQYARTRSIARKERSALLSRLGWLSLDLSELPAEPSVAIEGRPRTADVELGAFAVTPGQVSVLVTTSDGGEARAEVHVAAGRQVTVPLRVGETVTIEAPVEEPSDGSEADETDGEQPAKNQPAQGSPTVNYRPWAVASAVVGVVGLGMYIGYGAKSRRRYNDLQDDCSGGTCPASSQNDIDEGRRAQTTANVGFVLGALGAAGAVTLFVLDSRQRRGVALGVGPNQVTLGGTF